MRRKLSIVFECLISKYTKIHLNYRILVNQRPIKLQFRFSQHRKNTKMTVYTVV